jgi:polyisoprenoid-binding protein YceI
MGFQMILLVLTLISFAEPLLFDESRGKILFDMKASMHDVQGQATQFTAKIDVGEGGINTGTVSIPASQLTTFLDVRDKRMYEDVLQVIRFPTITYTILSMSGSTEGLNSGKGKGKITMTGILTVASVEREVTIPAAYMWTEDGSLKMAGKVQIKWPDFGLPDPSIMISKLYPLVNIKFSIASKPQN